MSLDVMRIGKVAHAGIALLYAYLLQPDFPTALTEFPMQGLRILRVQLSGDSKFDRQPKSRVRSTSSEYDREIQG